MESMCILMYGKYMHIKYGEYMHIKYGEYVHINVWRVCVY